MCSGAGGARGGQSSILSFHCPKSLSPAKLPPAVPAPPPPPPLPARMSASNHISSCTYGGIGYLSPLRLAVPPPASLPPSLPLTAIYPSLIGLRNLSRTGKDEASEGAKEGASEQTMEETEGRTFTFAILSLSSAARSLRRRDPRGKWVCSRQPCHIHERDRRSAHRDEV